MALDGLLIAKSSHELRLLPGMANRHGLIAGATGTGKTVTLQTIAESFSRLGVPVFLADVKGDLTGLSQPGNPANAKIVARREQLGLAAEPFEGCPTALWDVFGKAGLPIRATVSEMGPILLGRILGLNETQAAVLTIAFRVADERGLLLLDLKDLRAMVQYVGDNAKELRTAYGNVTPASIGAIQRTLLTLEDQGGHDLFGEPALDLDDLMRVDEQGRGVVNILAADKLLGAPQVYSTFLLWLLSELFENLPELGDPEKPKFVFFFDEAHLLFSDAPKALVDKIEQVVRLIRSKGVGVYFISQNPTDVPDAILGQLGNRVQHALRAFTPKDRKGIKAAAETFRTNPGLDVASALTELGIGEALVSFLDAKGMPTAVERAWVAPPRSLVGPASEEQRRALREGSPLRGRYEQALDRESAYEILTGRAQEAISAAEMEAAIAENARLAAEKEKQAAKEATEREKQAAKEAAAAEKERIAREKERAKQEAQYKKEMEQLEKATRARPRAGDDVVTKFGKTAAREVATTLGRTITRGILGGLFGINTASRSGRKR
jgi:DNA helicase HerA-like ATPase